MTFPIPTMSHLTLRDATGDDSAAIQNVTLSAYEEYAAVMHPLHWEFYRQSIIATLANVGPAEQLVAEQAGAVVGTVLLYPAGAVFFRPDGASGTLTWPELRLLAVTPEARGQGVGGALVAECMQRAQAAWAAAITLHTMDMMQAAMRMYEKIGFVRAPELDSRPVPEVWVKGYRFELS